PPEGPEVAAAPEFTARLAGDGAVELHGLVEDERARAAVDAFARARFGADAVLTATRFEDGLPDGWPVRVLAGLDALAELAEGSLRVRADLLELTGVSGNAEASDAIARLLSARLGPGAEFRLVLRYDRRLDPEAGLVAPAECLAEIASLQGAGKLTFAPGSARLTPPAAATLDAIAEVLRGCAEFPLEIAGHTDSQGRAEMNLRLSQERADAVLAGLLARRVSVAAMTAKGFGAAEPVADNGSEAGREANRRIEFRAAPGATAAAAPATTTADVAAAAPAAPAAAAAAVPPAAAAPPSAPPVAAGPQAGAAATLAAGAGAVGVAVESPGATTPRPRPRPARD
ncbi:MAG: OmpA family protein, partial [Rhodobacteraceae bacterium]|nr:OmpA family protein [Paracoccaceae bacterium]